MSVPCSTPKAGHGIIQGASGAHHQENQTIAEVIRDMAEPRPKKIRIDEDTRQGLLTILATMPSAFGYAQPTLTRVINAVLREFVVNHDPTANKGKATRQRRSKSE